VEVLPLTNKILMLHFDEGHIDYFGEEGQNRFDHNFLYGIELNTSAAGQTSSYFITSDDDNNYFILRNPIQVYRKAKGTEFNNIYDPGEVGAFKSHWVYLVLPDSLVSGKTYTLSLDGLASNSDEFTFTFDEFNQRSEAIKVNQVGYRPNTKKYAYISQWMGDGGNLDLNTFIQGRQFHVVRISDNAIMYSGTVNMRGEANTQESLSTGHYIPPNFSRADVAECDFTAFNGAGEFKIVVEGMGSSYPFEINDHVFAEPYYWSSRAIFLQRAGVEKEIEPGWNYPRGLHPDMAAGGVYYDPNYLYYLNNSHPSESNFDFSSNPITDIGDEFWGWYHDAGDWDGYPWHMHVAYSLMFLYDVKPDNFADGDVANRYKKAASAPYVEEGANGIPDVLDEAAWLVQCWRGIKDVLVAKGYGTGGVPDYQGRDIVPQNNYHSWNETRPLAITAESPLATFLYAGAAAYYAIHLKDLGFTAASSDWENEAINAYAWAENFMVANPGSEGSNNLVPKAKITPSSLLFRLTGDTQYQDDFVALTDLYNMPEPGWAGANYEDWGRFSYGMLPSSFPGLNSAKHTSIRDLITSRVDIFQVDYALANRKFRSTHINTRERFQIGAFSTPHTTAMAAAFAITGDAKYADAIQFAADYCMGGNELNMVWMTGVGDNPDRYTFHVDMQLMSDPNSKVYETPFYPGYTTYGGNNRGNDGFFQWVGDEAFSWSTAYPDAQSQWPRAEMRFQNIFSVWESSEFTIWQSLANTAFTYGYLSGDAGQIPNERPTVSLNLSDGQQLSTATPNVLSVNASPDTRKVKYYYEWQYIGESTDQANDFAFTWDISKYKGIGAGDDVLITARAYDNRGRSSEATEEGDKVVSIVVGAPDTEAPTVPINLTVSNVQGQSADVSWTASTDNTTVDWYELFNADTLFKTVSGTLASTELTGLSFSTTYNIKIRAKDLASNVSDFSPEVTFTTNAPATLSVTVVVAGQGTVDPAPGTYSYSEGTTVSFTTSPDQGWFQVSGPESLIVTQDTTVTFVFDEFTGATCSATGSITYEKWNGIAGTAVTDLTSLPAYPNSPDETGTLTQMEWNASTEDQFGLRVHGYLCVPSTGEYTFWVAGDDNVQLSISTNADPANKQVIAYHDGFTQLNVWDKYPGQKSSAVFLVENQKVYIEALLKEEGGGERLQVGWAKPGESTANPSQVIPGSVLTTFDGGAPTTYTLTVNSGSGDGDYEAGTVVNISAGTPPTGQEFDQWTGDISGVADINSGTTTLTMPTAAASVSATYKDSGAIADHQWLFNNNGNDEIGSLDATLIGNATYSSSSYEGAASLDLSNGVAKATIGTVSLPSQFSVSLWARNAGNQTHQNYLFANTAGSASGFQWYVNDYGGTNGKLVLLTKSGSGGTAHIMTSDNSFAFNQWNHVAFTFDGSANEVKMYINGNLEVTGTPSAGFDRARELFIGAMGNGANWNTWPGEIDDVRLFNQLLSDTEISSLFGASSYSLIVNSGSGDGDYEAGAILNILADAAPSGQEFDQWTGDVSVIADVSAASTTLTMPASVVSITATYQDIPTVTYALAVNSGSGGGDYEAETVVNISADTPPTGQEFDQWTGDVSGIADVNSASTALTMPAAAASVSATYKDITYSLTVNSGTGDGNYTAGTVVNIVADAAPSGQEFDAWTGDISGVADVNSVSTALTMPASVTSVSATYKDITYNLTVNSGTGDGNYTAGTIVNIVADAAPSGQEFDAWTGDVSGVADISAASTTLVMPASAVSITATYQDIPTVTYTLVVNSGSGDGDYEAGTVVDISADTPPAGQEFDQWTGDISGIAYVNSATTTLTTSAAATTVTANYQDTPSGCAADGFIPYSKWNNISGMELLILKSDPDYPNNPDETGTLTSMEWLGNTENNFGLRLEGIICVPTSGNYTFWIAGDDHVELNISLDGDPVNKSTIAYHDGWNFKDEWDKYPEQQSSVFQLTAGQQVYVEALMKENAGGERLQVGWLKPGESGSIPSEIVPGSVLSPYSGTAPITYNLTVNSGTGDGTYAAGTVVSIFADTAPTGQEFDVWTGDVSGIADVNSSITALTMPASATSVSATYKDLGVAADHHWLFNNNGNDEIGSLDATLIGNATYSSSSSYEGAASLDLSNGVAKATIGTVSLPNQFSVSLWARNAGNQTHQNYLFANTSGGTSGFQWYVNDYGGTNGKLVMLTQNSSGSPVYIRTSDNSFAFNQWNHVALTFDGSANEVKMYINGILEVTGTPKAGFDRARELFIGAMGNGGNWNTWPGEIDDVRLFNYLLSDTEISSVFGSSSAGSTVESRSNFNTVNAKPDVKLFPNPSQDGRFQLAFTGLESEAAVLITGMSGNQIAQYHVNTEVVSFDTPLGSGLYFVTVKSEKINKVLKLVVQ